MAFSKEPVRTAISVGEIRIVFRDDAPAGLPINGPEESISYQVLINYSDESQMWRKGDLAPHLTGAQITTIVNFVNAMRTKAVAEFIG